MSNKDEQVAPERIWIDPQNGIQLWFRSKPLDSPVAYIREDPVAPKSQDSSKQGESRSVEEESRDTPWPRCPVTRRPFFMNMDHPEIGEVPTFGGPFDSYTIPEVDDDGQLQCERYDHDAGAWVEGGEPTNIYLTTEQPSNDDLPPFLERHFKPEYPATTNNSSVSPSEEEVARECAEKIVPQLSDDGWVTFGHIKVDIETETEVFERTDPATERDAKVSEVAAIIASALHVHRAAVWKTAIGIANELRIKSTTDGENNMAFRIMTALESASQSGK